MFTSYILAILYLLNTHLYVCIIIININKNDKYKN